MIDRKKHIEDIAKMYAESLILYGVDITNKWETATSQHMALQQAYMFGQSDAIQRMWIPCSEMLPEINKRVLTVTDCGFVEVGKRIPMQKLEMSFGIKWEDDFNGVHSNIIAWMPLPDPYVEGED